MYVGHGKTCKFNGLKRFETILIGLSQFQKP